MQNYIELTAEQAAQPFGQDPAQESAGTLLCDIAEGDTCKIGEHEVIVLEHFEDGNTALICKDLLPDAMQFGEDNNYNGSYVDIRCQAFAHELASAIGWDDIVLHTADLTSDDGLKDYGAVERRASLLTTDLYRKYVDILDNFKIDTWWWLATAWSAPTHGSSTSIKCVCPSGFISTDYYFGNGGIGVRPFFILKSNIFVSK